MPIREWKFRIEDIINSINKINIYIAKHNIKSFKSSNITIDAVIRNIEIIGEAANHIPFKTRKKYPDIPWEQMRGIRNIIAHEYFGIDIKIVWYTAKKHLPKLKIKLEKLLAIEN